MSEQAKVRRVETWELRVPLPMPLLLGGAPLRYREYAIAFVHDSDGNVGSALGLTRDAPIQATVARLVAPRWEGQQLAGYRELYAATVHANRFHGSHGIFWRALSLCDCAMHDLLARRAGVPLYRLLSGTARCTPAILAGLYPVDGQEVETLSNLARTMATWQPAAIKVTGSGDLRRDTERMAACRQTIPGGPAFVLDLHGTARDVADVLTEAASWQALHMLWIEDPFAFDDFESLAELANGSPIPIAVGDEQAGLRHFRHLLTLGRVSVLRLDATVCGGVAAFLAIAAMAAQYGAAVSCHIFPYLHTHLAAVAPNVRYVEYMLPESHVDPAHLLLRNRLVWQAGCLAPAEAPGIGYDWDSAALSRYRVA